MALDKQDLADLLASLEPTGDESEARIVLSESIGGYSSAAESAVDSKGMLTGHWVPSANQASPSAI